MKIVIKTIVNGKPEEIYSKFDQKLFEALSPPIIDLKIKKFEGCRPGQEIELDLFYNKLFPPLKWKSIITEESIASDEIFFIDEGVILPPPLKFWRHIHRILKIKANTCLIIDEIEFTSKKPSLDLLIWPSLYLSFYIRKKIYKNYFRK